jgi:putative heme iron utilization protein
MGLTVEEVVRRMSAKAQSDKRVGVVFGTCESVGILYHGEGNYLARILAKKQELGEAIIGLISFEPGKPDEAQVEFFPEYADDSTAVSWMRCCAETIRKNAGK